MKTIIASIALVFAFSAGASTPRHTPQDIELCSLYGQMAYTIMNMRQQGRSMTELMKGEAARSDELIQLMITQAYKYPRFQSERHINQAKADFRNEVEVACLR
jgi:hypothetical protein